MILDRPGSLKCLLSALLMWCFIWNPVFSQELKPVELKPALPEGEAVLATDSDEYILGAGDVLSMIDMTASADGKPVQTTAPVLPDGTASIYPIGLIKAGGKTLRVLTEEVRQRYSSVARSPDFIIGIAHLRPVEVYVVGEVINPGLYRSEIDSGSRQIMLSATPFSGPGVQPAPKAPSGSSILDFLAPFSPVAAAGAAAAGVGAAPLAAQPRPNRNLGGDVAKIQAPTTMTTITAIQLAGGVKETADIRHVQVRHRNKVTKEVDLWSILVEGDAGADQLLAAGDVVVVPKGSTQFKAEALGLTASQSRVVKVFGGVKSPGIYELSPQDDVLSVISRAGGFTETAIQSKVWLSRKMPDGKQRHLKVSIRKSMKHHDVQGRSPLASGDIVEVRESMVKKVAPRALTIGATFFSAFMILYLSRRIVDQSQPQQVGGGGITQTNGGPLGLPSVF